MAAPNVEELERQFNAAMEDADKGTTLEAIRRVYGEFESEDPEAVSAIVHSRFEITIHSFFLDGRSYKGVRGFAAWRKEMDKLFDEERFQPVGVRSAGSDRWVVLGRMHVKEADGGAELDVPLAHVLEQRDRKVARLAIYSDITAALDSVGLYH
ncbi:MAG: nuclear transport factor 2 family protein [Actinomycetota bacterium]|nr:nuclear transport factor 2 family protein [Actinomycetota bacterium]